MAKINLLPVDLSPKSSLNKIAATLKQISIYAMVVFLVLGMIAAGFFIIMANQVRNLESKQESLKQQLEAMSTSEQSFVLVRDRLGKLKQVLGEKKSSDTLDKVDTLIARMPETISVSEAEISADKTEVNLLARNSSDLPQIFGPVLIQSGFSKVILKSINFNPSAGYLVTLEVGL